MNKAIAIEAALRHRGLRNEEPAPTPVVEAPVFWCDERTLGKVLAMSPDEFRRWATYVQARRTIGDD